MDKTLGAKNKTTNRLLLSMLIMLKKSHQDHSVPYPKDNLQINAINWLCKLIINIFLSRGSFCLLQVRTMTIIFLKYKTMFCFHFIIIEISLCNIEKSFLIQNSIREMYGCHERSQKNPSHVKL